MGPVTTTTATLDTPLEGQGAAASTPATEPTPSLSAPAAPQDTPAPDARVASLEQTIRQLEGRVAKAEDPAAAQRLETQLERLRRQQERLAIKLDPSITEAETAEKLAVLDAEEKQAAEVASLVAYGKKIAGWAKADLDDAGLSTDHPKVKEIIDKEWRSAQSVADLDAVYTRIKEMARTEKAAAAKRNDAEAQKRAEAERIRANRTDGVLALGGSPSTPAAPNREPTIDDLVKKGKDLHFMSPKERAEFTAQWNAARKRKA